MTTDKPLPRRTRAFHSFILRFQRFIRCSVRVATRLQERRLTLHRELCVPGITLACFYFKGPLRSNSVRLINKAFVTQKPSVSSTWHYKNGNGTIQDLFQKAVSFCFYACNHKIYTLLLPILFFPPLIYSYILNQ